MTTVDEALARAVEHLRPPPVETLPQWIERVVRLPEGVAQPGKVKLWPPQVEVAASIGDPEIERVTWLKAVRSGYTFLVACAIARNVLDDPCHAIVLMPTEADAIRPWSMRPAPDISRLVSRRLPLAIPTRPAR